MNRTVPQQTVAACLIELVTELGYERLISTGRVGPLLADRLGPEGGSARREIRVVDTLAADGFVGELRSGVPLDDVTTRFITSTGFEAESARWAVEAWTGALFGPRQPDTTSGAVAKTFQPPATAVVTPPTERLAQPSRPTVADAPGSVPLAMDSAGASTRRQRALWDWFAKERPGAPIASVLGYAESNIWAQLAVVAMIVAAGISLLLGNVVILPGALVILVLALSTTRYGVVLTDRDLVVVVLSIGGRPKRMASEWSRGDVSAQWWSNPVYGCLSLTAADGKSQKLHVGRRERGSAEAIAASLPSHGAQPAPSARYAAALVVLALIGAQVGIAAALSRPPSDPGLVIVDSGTSGDRTTGSAGETSGDSTGGTEGTAGGSSEGDGTSSQGRIYRTEHLEAVVPTGWSVAESDSDESITLSSAGATANVIFTAEPVPTGTFADDYADLSTPSLRSLPGYRELSSKDGLVFDGRLGVKRRFTWQPDDRATPVYQEQHYWASGGTGFTATATATSLADLDRLDEVLDQLLANPA